MLVLRVSKTGWSVGRTDSRLDVLTNITSLEASGFESACYFPADDYISVDVYAMSGYVKSSCSDQ